MLTYNPKHRITVHDAMKHPFLKSLWDENDPEDLEHPDLRSGGVDNSWEKGEFGDYKREMLKEIDRFNRSNDKVKSEMTVEY